MTDNVTADPGTGGAQFATDDVGGIHYPISKLAVGALDSVTLLTGGNGVVDAGCLRVTIASDSTGAIDVGTVTSVTTCSTVTNLAQLGGAAISMNTGVRDAGTQRVTIATDDSVPVTIATVPSHAVTNAGTFVVQEDGASLTALQLIDNAIVAHDAAVSGSTGVSILGLEARSTEPTAVANADATRGIASLLGKQVQLPYAIPAQTWSYATATLGVVDTAADEAKAAGGAGVRHYITSAQVINAHATTSTEVEIRDGATVLWRGWAQAAGGGCAAKFDPPLRGTANTAVNVANITTASQTYFNLQGYSAAE